MYVCMYVILNMYVCTDITYYLTYSHYGPNRKMLETAFPRPYTLFLEYPSDYVHNKPFKSMLGDGIGEKLIFAKKLQPQTNETQYTKRVMKIIQYQW
jgi:hypothetical protein